MVVTPSSKWRERQRNATLTEIKTVGRRLLVTGGPNALTVRAITREMGMTPAAIYRYFPSLDALVAALCVDLFAELRGVIESARDQTAPDPLSRLDEMARAFRRWSLAHPTEFGLMLGPPLPDVGHTGAAMSSGSIVSFGAPFLAEFGDLWGQGNLDPPPMDPAAHRLGPQLLGPYVAEHAAGLPIEVVLVFLGAWTRLYGLVAMEVFGHMSWAVTDVEALFESELLSFAHQMTRGRKSAATTPKERRRR